MYMHKFKKYLIIERVAESIVIVVVERKTRSQLKCYCWYLE